MPGKLIVIEGVDGSGKTTQFQLLSKRLTENNYSVQTMHFPRHQNPFFGIMVDQYLTGEFGDPTKLHPCLSSLLYAMDRWEAKKQLQNWLKEGFVLLDRYTTSNVAHQSGKIADLKKRDEFLAWLDELEYNVLKIPKPDLVLVLDVPIKFVLDLLEKRSQEDKGYIKGKKDMLESSIKHLTDTYQAYLYAVQKYDYWKKIECVENDQLLSIEQIHEKIWDVVKRIL